MCFFQVQKICEKDGQYTHIFIIFKPSWCQLKRGKKQLKSTNTIALSYGSVLCKLVCANNQNILYSSLRSRSKMLLQLSAVGSLSWNSLWNPWSPSLLSSPQYCCSKPSTPWMKTEKKIFQICHPKNGLFVHQNAPKTKDTLIIDINWYYIIPWATSPYFGSFSTRSYQASQASQLDGFC